MTWRQDNNERVARVLARLRTAEEALRDLAVECGTFPDNDLTARNVKDWALDMAAQAATEAAVVKRLLL